MYGSFWVCLVRKSQTYWYKYYRKKSLRRLFSKRQPFACFHPLTLSHDLLHFDVTFFSQCNGLTDHPPVLNQFSIYANAPSASKEAPPFPWLLSKYLPMVYCLIVRNTSRIILSLIYYISFVFRALHPVLLLFYFPFLLFFISDQPSTHFSTEILSSAIKSLFIKLFCPFS